MSQQEVSSSIDIPDKKYQEEVTSESTKMQEVSLSYEDTHPSEDFLAKFFALIEDLGPINVDTTEPIVYVAICISDDQDTISYMQLKMDLFGWRDKNNIREWYEAVCNQILSVAYQATLDCDKKEYAPHIEYMKAQFYPQ